MHDVRAYFEFGVKGIMNSVSLTFDENRIFTKTF